MLCIFISAGELIILRRRDDDHCLRGAGDFCMDGNAGRGLHKHALLALAAEAGVQVDGHGSRT